MYDAESIIERHNLTVADVEQLFNNQLFGFRYDERELKFVTDADIIRQDLSTHAMPKLSITSSLPKKVLISPDIYICNNHSFAETNLGISVFSKPVSDS